VTYKAIVVNVVIASPSDVSQERRIAEDVMREWNANHSKARHLVLMPVGWETHSAPQMGGRPQAILNRQILSDCDILVAAFWTRLGSPTGKAPSGTVEEIEEHRAAGGTVLLYFSRAPVQLESVDSAQYKALVAFKESCRRGALFAEYQDPAGFRNIFRNDLTQTVNRLFPGDMSQEAEEDSSVSLSPLSTDATQLLVEAAKAPDGLIVQRYSDDSLSVRTNGRDFCAEPGNPRSEACLRRMIDELEGAGLIEDRSGGKRQVFSVTSRGYETADRHGAA